MTFIHFVDGDDNPYWDYTITLAPGETRIIANFVVGQPSKAAAAAKAAQLVGLPDNAVQCLTPAERAAITNFGPVAAPGADPGPDGPRRPRTPARRLRPADPAAALGRRVGLLRQSLERGDPSRGRPFCTFYTPRAA